MYIRSQNSTSCSSVGKSTDKAVGWSDFFIVKILTLKRKICRKTNLTKTLLQTSSLQIFCSTFSKCCVGFELTSFCQLKLRIAGLQYFHTHQRVENEIKNTAALTAAKSAVFNTLRRFIILF